MNMASTTLRATMAWSTLLLTTTGSPGSTGFERFRRPRR